MSSLTGKNWSEAESTKIKELLDEGSSVLRDIEDLRAGLKDTVTSIAEELDIPAKYLNKAIRSFHKGNFLDSKDELSDVEEILAAGDKT